MNKLWVRLTAAFLVVALVAVGAVALVVNRTTASSFRSYIGQQSSANASADLIQALEAHYASAGSWEGAQAIMAEARSGRGAGQGQGQGHGGGSASGGSAGNNSAGTLFLLAETDYAVIAASNTQHVGRALTENEREQAYPLQVESQTIGYLVREAVAAQALDQAQQGFLDDVTRALTLAAAGAMALALVMGLGFSWLTLRPLRHLRQSAAAIAQGKLSTQMPAEGTAEFRQVAAAFNQMSSALAESEVVRQRMTSDIAHELRSPVSVMRAQVEAMMDGVFLLNAEQLAVVYDQTLHLGRLVEDLRTLTRAEAGRLPLEKAAIDPAAFVQRVAADFAPLAQEETITLSTEIAPALPPIQADADRLRQIFANLLTNALAHTPSGGHILLSAATTESGVRFAVKDTGLGLTTEQAAHVFERFYRADDARQRDQSGSGLGLAITQELVRLHGGRIWMESAPGVGSTVIFEIPAREARAIPPTDV